jgi:hypothetical protein
MRKCVVLLVLAVFATAAGAAAADDAFVGTWKLNVEKSKFTPGPAPKSETVTIEPGGKVSVEEVMADGRTMSWGYTATADTPAAITGMENSTVVEKRVGDRVVEHTWKLGDMSNMTGRGLLSKNGKSMTYTLKGTNGKGEAVHNVEIFEKQ